MPLGIRITLSLPVGIGNILGVDDGPTTSSSTMTSTGGVGGTDGSGGNGSGTTTTTPDQPPPTTTPPTTTTTSFSTPPTPPPTTTTTMDGSITPTPPISTSRTSATLTDFSTNSIVSSTRNVTASNNTISTAIAQISSDADIPTNAVTETTSTTDAAGSVMIITTTRYTYPTQTLEPLLAANHGRHVSGGAIAGIVVGLSAFLLLLFLFLVLMVRRKQRKYRNHMRASMTSWLDDAPVVSSNRTDRAFDAIESAWFSALYALRLKRKHEPPFETPSLTEKEVTPTTLSSLTRKLSPRRTSTQTPALEILAEAPPKAIDQGWPYTQDSSFVESSFSDPFVSQNGEQGATHSTTLEDVPNPRLTLRALHDTHGVASFGSTATMDDAMDYTRQLVPPHKPASVQTFETQADA